MRKQELKCNKKYIQSIFFDIRGFNEIPVFKVLQVDCI